MYSKLQSKLGLLFSITALSDFELGEAAMNLHEHCFADLQLTLADEAVQLSAYMKHASPENCFPLAALRHLCNAIIVETFQMLT